jgi:hypothetical protein
MAVTKNPRIENNELTKIQHRLGSWKNKRGQNEGITWNVAENKRA